MLEGFTGALAHRPRIGTALRLGSALLADLRETVDARDLDLPHAGFVERPCQSRARRSGIGRLSKRADKRADATVGGRGVERDTAHVVFGKVGAELAGLAGLLAETHAHVVGVHLVLDTHERHGAEQARHVVDARPKLLDGRVEGTVVRGVKAAGAE